MRAASNVPSGLPAPQVSLSINSGDDQKQTDFKAGSIYDSNQPEVRGIEPFVVVDIGDGLQIFVPKSLTVSVSDAKRTYPALVTIPVRDVNGNLYDLETLLEEKHPNSATHIPESVTVDPVFSARKSLFYTQVLQDQKELFASGRYPNAKAVLESLAAPGISYPLNLPPINPCLSELSRDQY